ncbi:MAG TPA: C25 family cysteine peptidase [Cyclobacteriaceae bacterium]|nr:C25 family cysteine peptidase [Cyclobacteriaceae bacterium]
MRRILFFAVFTFCWTVSFGQFGNEWIKSNQVYFKIPVARDSLYRLTYSDLVNAGFPTGAVDPRRIQLFHRGVEQAIHVEGESDASFDPNDYIEFYGQRNDGTLDAGLYEPSTSQPHPYINLYSDSTYYFLTFNPLAVLGKRMANFSEVNVTNIPKEGYAFDQRMLILKNQYSGGNTENTYFQKTAFELGEGWTGTMIREGQFLDYQLTNIENGVASGGLPQLELLLVGRGDLAHQIEISVGPDVSSLRVLTTEGFDGFATQLVNTSVNWEDIGSNGKFTVRVRTLGVGGSPDRVSASYIKLRYPREVSMAGGKNVFRLRESSSGKSYVEITNPISQAKLYDVTDPDNVVRIGTTLTSTLNAVVPNTTLERKLRVVNTFATPPVKPVGFRFINPSGANYIIISNRLLMKPANGYSDVVRAYGAYRASVEGGSYDTLVMDVDQLYNQFNYGEPSPLAIKRFMQFLLSSKTPRYLLIIGKGLDISYDYFRYSTASAFSYFKNLVPSAGYPASDMYFTVGMNGTSYEPAVPTGRIPALLPEHVAAYLNKVKEMESQPYNALWRKGVLHLSGGINPGEPERFKSHLEGFQSIAEDVYLGGNVKAIPKRSTDIDFINVSDQVNQGLNLITFFGHSSAINIDFDIGYVTDPALGYNNAGKYPTLLLNGCNAGSFFINRTLFGEDWINAANKGAVGFIAHTSFGLEYTLQRYSNTFYEVGYGDSVFIKKGLGDIQKEVARRYMENSPPSSPHITQVQQMVLLGDPAVKLFGAAKTDYAITEQDIAIQSFDDLPVTALSDSFAIKINVRNFGVVDEKNFRINVTQTFADQSSVVYDSVFSPVYYSDTLTFIIRRSNNQGGGENKFKIEIDPNGLLDELTRDNNVVEYNYLIPLNRTKNLYPYDYAIVHDTDVTLSFQATDLLTDERSFLVEVDTVNTFDSPFKKQFSTQGKVLTMQSVQLLTQDSTAYYWRTKLAEPTPGESEEWEQSSFSYINNGQDGWAQIHFPQFLKNQGKGLVIDPELRELVLEETVTSVYINNFGSSAGTTNLNVSVKLNGAEYQLPSTSTTERVPCRNNTINLIAFDKTTTTPYPGIPFIFQDSRTCGREPQVIVSFRVTDLERINPTSGSPEGIGKYIDNVTPGDSVVLFSIGDAGYALWSAAVKSKLGELGISVAQIDALQPGEPVVIFARKGATPGSAIVYKTNTLPVNQASLQVNETITGRATSGTMRSTLIGPAMAWQSLSSKIETPETNDMVSVNVVGVALDGQETILLSGISDDADLSGISAEDYPYLRLVYEAQDDLNLTATQLDNWLVLFTPVAEGIVFYKGQSEPVTLQEGEDWRGEYGFVNITDQSFPDSLLVRMTYFNTTTRTSIDATRNIKSPAPGDTTDFSFVLATTGRGGLNNVDVYVNPKIVPEQYYDNNILELTNYLNVEVDQFKPVLEVTVDGRILMDGDFVSPNPDIVMRLRDENRVIQKTDTLGVNIFLTYPCDLDDCNATPVYFSREDVKWLPATDTSDFKVIFDPTGLPDGFYTLSVEMSDGRSNKSGEPYTITFQVNSESSVILLAPYPNPSHEFFTFTLLISGEASPDNFSLEIFGVDGRKIRELIDLPTIIGRNEITWNGESADGSHLPAGIYFYRINLQQNGKDVPIKVLANTSYFNRGYGKLVLTR